MCVYGQHRKLFQWWTVFERFSVPLIMRQYRCLANDALKMFTILFEGYFFVDLV